jgi:hypothetical protein
MEINIKYVNPNPWHNDLYDLVLGEEDEDSVEIEELEPLEEGEPPVLLPKEPTNEIKPLTFETFEITAPEKQKYSFVLPILVCLSGALAIAGFTGLALKPSTVFLALIPVGCVLNVVTLAALYLVPKESLKTLIKV